MLLEGESSFEYSERSEREVNGGSRFEGTSRSSGCVVVNGRSRIEGVCRSSGCVILCGDSEYWLGAERALAGVGRGASSS